MKKIFPVITASLVVGLSGLTPSVMAQTVSESQTARNETVGFQVAVPAGWSVTRASGTDPEQDFRNGEFRFSLSSDEGAQAEEGNAIKFNEAQTSTDRPLPFVEIVVHTKTEEQVRGFAQLFEQAVEGMGVKFSRKNQEFTTPYAKGYDYTYSMGTPVRWIILHANGKQAVIKAFVASMDTRLFDEVQPTIDAVVNSIKLE